jgi:hypothetical protein
MTIYLFSTWSEAWATCREKNQPIVVRVDETEKEMPGCFFNRIFPSGKWQATRKTSISEADIVKDKRGND